MKVRILPSTGTIFPLLALLASRFFQWVEDLGRWDGLWQGDSSSDWGIFPAGGACRRLFFSSGWKIWVVERLVNVHFLPVTGRIGEGL